MKHQKILEYAKEFLASQTPDSNMLDQHSSKDLDMDQVFLRFNKMQTSPGDAVLYHRLHHPDYQPERFQRHLHLRNAMESDPRLHEYLTKNLKKTGRQGRGHLGCFLQRITSTPLYQSRHWLLIPTLAPLILLGVILFSPQPILILMLFLLLGINIFIHYQIKRSTEADYPSLFYLAKILGTILKLRKSPYKAILSPYFSDELKNGQIKMIQRKCIWFYQPLSPTIDVLFTIMEYLKIFFLVEANTYLNMVGYLLKHRDLLLEAYKDLGEVDQIMSEYSIQKSEKCCTPVFSENSDRIDATNLYHPLIENGVSNSFSIAKSGNIVTGTNMAGKSSFLRTLGINQIIAQTLFLAMADEYTCGSFRIMTAIHSHDNLLENQSKYYNEVRRIKKILTHIENSDQQWLILIDEILSGTNTHDRVRAAINILEYMNRGKTATILAATHDRDIAQALEDQFDTWYFSEELTETDLTFSYKIQKGIVNHTNAFKILEFFDFPSEITGESPLLTKRNK